MFRVRRWRKREGTALVTAVLAVVFALAFAPSLAGAPLTSGFFHNACRGSTDDVLHASR